MFKGSNVALITPFKDNKLDKEAYVKLIHFHLENGTHGLVPAGTTGESPTLNHEEHEQVIELCIKESKGKIPVIAGTGSNSTEEAISLTKHAEKVGADGALIVTPYYNKPTQEGLYQHYKAINDNTNLPIIIYNIPSRCVIDMSVDTMARLYELKNIIGVKDATNDLTRPLKLKKMISHKKFFQLSGEDETQLAYLAQGGDGVISVTANIAPKKVADLHKSWFAGDISESMKIDTELFSLNNALFLEANPCPVKYAAFKLGICNYELRLPLCKISEKNELIVDNVLKDLNITFD